MGRRKNALVGNAADSEQVRRADRKTKVTRDDQLDDMRAVLRTFEGRRLLWRLLDQTNAFESVFSQDAGIMAYQSGRQDFGHFLIIEIGEADPDAWILMQQEANNMDANVVEPEPTEHDA